jgi:hypothetical protein
METVFNPLLKKGLQYISDGSSGITQGAADTRYVNVSGDTMTGPLILTGSGGLLNVGGDNPDATANGIINVETSFTKKLIFWGEEPNGYTRIEFRPERRTGGDKSDVQFVVHNLHEGDNSVHQHFSIYTSDTNGDPSKRLNIPYNVDVAEFELVHSTLTVNDVGVLGAAEYQVYINNTSEQVNATRMLYVWQQNSSSTSAVAEIENAGSGVALTLDQNGAGQALFIDHDDTGTGVTLNLDRDGNSTSQIVGQQIDVDNAGNGGAVGLDIFPVTATGGTVIGLKVRLPSGGSSNYALNLVDTGGTAAGGITFGTDVQLYRSAANTLKTDDGIIGDVGTGSTTNLTLIRNNTSNKNAIVMQGLQAGGRTNLVWRDENGVDIARMAAHNADDPDSDNTHWQIYTPNADGTTMVSRFAIDSKTDTPVAEFGQQLRINSNLSQTALYVIQATNNTGLQISSSATSADSINIDAANTSGIVLDVNHVPGAASTAQLATFDNDSNTTGNAVTITNNGTGKGFLVQQDGVLAANNEALRVYSNAAITNGGSVLVRFFLDNASSNKRVLEIVNDGSSQALFIDNNGTAQAIAIDHDGGGSASSLDVDRDGASSSLISGITVDVDNTSTGGAVGIDVANITATSGVVAGMRIALPSGGSTNYALQLSDATGVAAGGITFGTDTNLYRSAANTLKTDDSLLISVAENGLRVTNTTDNASVQAAIFEGDRATVAANDEVYVSFNLSDSAGNQEEFGRITMRATTVTNASEASRMAFSVRNAGNLGAEVFLTASALSPAANDGNALGTTSLMWADLFLASGGVINFNNGDVTMTHSTDTLTIAGGTVVMTDLQINETAYYDAEVDNGNSGTSKTIDWSVGNVQKITWTGNCTLTFIAPPGPCHLTLRGIGDGTGRTLTFPAPVKGLGSYSPTGTSAHWDIISLYYDGTNYTASYLQGYS